MVVVVMVRCVLCVLGRSCLQYHLCACSRVLGTCEQMLTLCPFQFDHNKSICHMLSLLLFCFFLL